MKLKLGILYLSPTYVCEIAERVYLAMSTVYGQDIFSTLQSLLPPLKDSTDLLRQAIALPHSPAAKEKRHALKLRLVNQLTLLAMDVYTVAGGDLVKLASSGFELKKPSIPNTQPMIAPLNVRAIHYGLTGHVKLRCKAVKYARNYSVQYCSPDGDWITVPIFGNTLHMIIGGLTRGIEYRFRICVMGSTGTSDWSDEATALVL